MYIKNSSSGQILLITLLVLTVGLTIALAVISRSRTDVTIGNQIEDSARAFSAAEAGIERALISGQSPGAQTLSGGLASYDTSVNAIGGAPGSYGFSQRTTRGDAETLWLVNHNADGSINETRVYTSDQIDVCWRGAGGTPAMAVTVLFKRGTNYLVAKGAFDPDGTRRITNNFSNASGPSTRCGQTTVYSTTISFSGLATSPAINVNSDTLLLMRLRPVYADASIYVNSGVTTLPRQGDIITSSGSTNTGTTRRIVVSRQYRSAPSIFDAAVVSQTDFTH